MVPIRSGRCFQGWFELERFLRSNGSGVDEGRSEEREEKGGPGEHLPWVEGGGVRSREERGGRMREGVL